MNKDGKKIIYSGMQPTGVPSLGNYLGALKNWGDMQDESDFVCIYAIADLHAITVRQVPAELRRRSRELFTLYLAMGLDPQKSIIYFQSHVKAHTELNWYLNCFTYMGELSRMTQFKEKSQRHLENINAGLFTYPVLQAADILLYQTDIVPIGEDQRQHLEICRDIAQRFNAIYGDVFTIPEARIPKNGARIMSLQNPDKKMSKSDDDNNSIINILDEPTVILNKIKRAVTDSDNEVRYTPEKPGISNLINIYASVTGLSVSEIEAKFTGVGYGTFKKEVGEAVVDVLSPVQNRFKSLSENKDYVNGIIAEGAKKAEAIADKTLAKVKKKLGYL